MGLDGGGWQQEREEGHVIALPEQRFGSLDQS